MTSTDPRPTAWQVRRTKAVVRWYLDQYHSSGHNPGFPAMYTDPTRVGALAVSMERLRAGQSEALYRALVATIMFQAMRDVLVQRILRRLHHADANELTGSRGLVQLAHATACDHIKSVEALSSCTLAKDASTKRGICTTHPELECPLKRHTELLGRYGHFGKFPTSLAHRLHETGVDDLAGLYEQARQGRSRTEAAHWIRGVLTGAWRVSDKISAMFLSLVSNPDVLTGAPWAEGLEWEQFVVIDTNVDQYLKLIGYRGPWTYGSRQAMIERLARRVRLDELDERLRRYNPRIVQQAMFLFMSVSNRRAHPADCSQEGWEACQCCPATVRTLCPLQTSRSVESRLQVRLVGGTAS